MQTHKTSASRALGLKRPRKERGVEGGKQDGMGYYDVKHVLLMQSLASYPNQGDAICRSCQITLLIRAAEKVPMAESDAVCHAPEIRDASALQSADAPCKCAAAAVKT